jgi:hypothetical protein
MGDDHVCAQEIRLLKAPCEETPEEFSKKAHSTPL